MIGRFASALLILWALGFGCILVRGNDPFAGALSLLRKFLLLPWLQKLGAISFPLYLVHWPVIMGMLALLLKFAPQISSVQALAVLIVAGIPVMLGCAQLLHVLVEQPGMALGKKFGRRPSVPASAEAAPGA